MNVASGSDSAAAYASERNLSRASYRDALSWLFGTQLFGIKLGLESIHRLLAELRVDCPKPRIIHVAGTNGKGSVCAMAASICQAEGYRTGLFTSPHLVTFRERIQVNGAMITEAEVVAALSAIRELIRDWEPHPTFFEITTALAHRYFADTDCDIVVLETGMGGRLDATNAITPVVSVITPIALDHQKWLGHTIAEIAGEKAGIIKPHVPVVSASQTEAAASVISARASECAAPLEFIPSDPSRRQTNLIGAHQQQNAALAIGALRAARISVSERAINRGLAQVSWPARFQRWNDRIVIDGAHNPAGARVLAHTWREQFGDERAAVVIAMLTDKDAAGFAEAITPIAARIVLPRARSERAARPADLASIFAPIATAVEISLGPSLRHALDRLASAPEPILITGSLHFAGEALATLRGHSDELEDCLQ